MTTEPTFEKIQILKEKEFEKKFDEMSDIPFLLEYFFLNPTNN